MPTMTNEQNKPAPGTTIFFRATPKLRKAIDDRVKARQREVDASGLGGSITLSSVVREIVAKELLGLQQP